MGYSIRPQHIQINELIKYMKNCHMTLYFIPILLWTTKALLFRTLVAM